MSKTKISQKIKSLLETNKGYDFTQALELANELTNNKFIYLNDVSTPLEMIEAKEELLLSLENYK